METDDRGLDLFDDCTHCGIERPAPGVSDGRGRIDSEFEIIRLEPFPPRVLAGVIRHWHSMCKKIEMERPVARRSAELYDLRTNLLGAQHSSGQSSEPARSRNRDRKIDVGRSRHRRLQDGDVDRE
jgi:hypothetical protein